MQRWGVRQDSTTAGLLLAACLKGGNPVLAAQLAEQSRALGMLSDEAAAAAVAQAAAAAQVPPLPAALPATLPPPPPACSASRASPAPGFPGGGGGGGGVIQSQFHGYGASRGGKASNGPSAPPSKLGGGRQAPGDGGAGNMHTPPCSDVRAQTSSMPIAAALR